MKILVYSSSNANTISSNFGEPEYSYFFVLREFMPVLEQLGEVIVIEDPESEVDAIYDAAREEGEFCVFLTFMPPHKTHLGNRCPTVPVLAWEFNDLPSETWDDEPRNDWRLPLGIFGAAITHSSHAQAVIRKALRPDFPVVSIPSPVWDRFRPLTPPQPKSGYSDGFDLVVDGIVLDSREHDFGESFAGNIDRYRQEGKKLTVSGVSYTSVFNPIDDRKNWKDMVTAFCWGLREQEDATLILKLTCRHTQTWPAMVDECLAELPETRARLIFLSGYLDDASYSNLATHTSYAVNSSRGEGQCLPLMEYMSCGTPAISPRHTGMIDYISPDNSFVVESGLEPAAWPDDTRRAYRTTQYRVNWDSLRQCFSRSYEAARNKPLIYRSKSHKAATAMRKHCSRANAKQQLEAFLALLEQHHRQNLELQQSSLSV